MFKSKGKRYKKATKIAGFFIVVSSGCVYQIYKSKNLIIHVHSRIWGNKKLLKRIILIYTILTPKFTKAMDGYRWDEGN